MATTTREKRHAHRTGPRSQGRGLARRQDGRSALTDAIRGFIDTNEPRHVSGESTEAWPALQQGCSPAPMPVLASHKDGGLAEWPVTTT